jgi:hypothetical protein
VGVNVDGHVIPVLLLVNIYVHANARVVFFHDDRTFFLHDDRTFFLYYDLRRLCRRRRVGGSGSYWRRRLLTTSDPE